MSEDVNHQQFRFLGSCTKGHGGVCDWTQRFGEGRIETLVAGLAETSRLHAPTKEVEAEIEVSRVVGIVAKERHRRGPKAINRSLAAHYSVSDCRCQD